MPDPKRLETPENMEIRQSYKDELAQKKQVKPDDVVAAATEIYQGEFGHLIEDEDALHGLWNKAASLYLEHRDQAKSNGDLIDLIVRGLHGDGLTVFEQDSEESAHGVQSTAGNF